MRRAAGGCDPNGAWFAGETSWLAHDLALDRAQCTLAYWHQPTFSVAGATARPAGIADGSGLAAAGGASADARPARPVRMREAP